MHATIKRMRVCRMFGGRVTFWLVFLFSTSFAPVHSTPALNKGVNVYDWFQQSPKKLITQEDLEQIRSAGFDHIRIPVDPLFLGWNPSTGAELAKLPDLRIAIEMAVRANLDVVLDIHPDVITMQRIEQSTDTERRFVLLWEQLAKHLAPFSPDHLAFELLNEPQYYRWSSIRWSALQDRLFTIVRRQAPNHLILATGRFGSSAEGLAEVVPLPDENVAYVFHFYLPYIFTHQGADWMANDANTAAGFFAGLGYPPRPGMAMPNFAVPDNRRQQATQEFLGYLQQPWGPRYIAQRMAPAIAWGKKHRKRIICNEFGVLRTKVDHDARFRWIQDVRMALEANGIGWTVWGYTDAFGITKEIERGFTTARVFEQEAFGALNLKKRP